jgi:hypothetical protein
VMSIARSCPRKGSSSLGERSTAGRGSTQPSPMFDDRLRASTVVDAEPAASSTLHAWPRSERRLRLTLNRTVRSSVDPCAVSGFGDPLDLR